MKEKCIGYLAPQYYNDKIQPGHPAVFDELLKEFTVKAQEIPQPCWFDKGSELFYSYEGKSYSIFPGMLDCSGEVLAIIKDELIDRMYELGAYEMFYAGMPD
ncbi:hypothetical protein D6853_07985 [Butyrivibrio sp. X503]|uniref:hypothetical protein n=1 Tax=Butyrivibrio sp. X503 TaxID=2364878 RepID=UPI000EA87D83|nr:hypothetical protein [Butyrivibrio sp. X503]RKM55494.1 hypothetical protein D6853_07985 [Butyrivibrio sp. X503]